MSKAGEIDRLTKLIRPDIGIITNVGEAHIENFNNLQGIAHAKGEIINNIKEGGTIILNRDDSFLIFCKKSKIQNLKIVSFGKNKKSDVCAIEKNFIKNNNSINVKIDHQIFSLKTRNLNIYNILSSIAL